jgi:hypothetical protein
MNPSNKSLKRLFLIASIGLFIASLTQDCYCTDSRCANSIAVLLSGSLGFFLSPGGFTWLANPFIIISWINKNRKKSLIYSTLAFTLSLSFLFFNKIIDNESGDYNQITGYRLGYWLWLSSIAVAAVGNLILFVLERQKHSI